MVLLCSNTRKRVGARSQTTQVTLRIDAICISQRDPEEKILQLAIMVDICAKAEETLIWIGVNILRSL